MSKSGDNSSDERTGKSRALAWMLCLLLIPASATAQQHCLVWDERGWGPPPARQVHAMAYDSRRGVTVLFGGTSDSNTLSDTWEWDGSTWRLVSNGALRPRRAHGMVYDSVRGVIVLFGGEERYLAPPFDETWLWDGAVWTRVQGPAPPARYAHSMAFDEQRGVTVVHGGWNQQVALYDTWEFDGATWRQVAAGGPPARHAPMTYDRDRGETVLHLGYERQTWRWNGVQWSIISTEGPRNFWTQMAFDSLRGVCVLFGGNGGSAPSNATWTWDGGVWRELIVADPPTRRELPALAFDSLRGATVVFGGRYGSEYNDTQELAPRFWIAAHPQDVVAGHGQGAEFSVTIGGQQPYTYQWRRNGQPLTDGGTISGSLTETLTIRRVGTTDAGAYDVVMTPLCGTMLSDSATLAVVRPVLQASTYCPQSGPALVQWSEATADGSVILLFASDAGMFLIPSGHPCAGSRLDLALRGLHVIHEGRSDASGSGWFQRVAPQAACGGRIQLLDVASCGLSEAMVFE